MNLSHSEITKCLAVIRQLNSELSSFPIRTRAGEQLLELLNADFFASYIWNPAENKFTEGLHINMSPDNIKEYESYFQFHDPITYRMQRYRRAVSTNEVMAQRDLIRTEFYNDFLRKDGLYYGVNLYIYDGDQNIGDLRIWRAKRGAAFDQHSLQILDLIAPHFQNAMKNISSFQKIHAQASPMSSAPEGTRLTQRENQVMLGLISGKPDRQIAQDLYVSLPTVRTHVRHIYEKLGIHNRASLCNKVLLCG